MRNERRKINHWRRVFLGICLFISAFSAFAQQYTGMSGLIHIPSADMDESGDARIGVHFLNKEFTPDVLVYDEKKYHTMSYYLSITPFRWLELGYTCTLLRSTKIKHGIEDVEHPGLNRKDRYFSLKIQPVREKEGKWWPSVAVGMNDMFSNRKVKEPLVDPESGKPKSIGNSLFANYYVAVSKHFDYGEHRFGLHVSYRDWKRDRNSKWNSVVGGITYQPSFQQNLRVIAEYTGDDVNVGFDWKLWKYLLIQSSLQNGKYFSGGVCFCINLL